MAGAKVEDGTCGVTQQDSICVFSSTVMGMGECMLPLPLTAAATQAAALAALAAAVEEGLGGSEDVTIGSILHHGRLSLTHKQTIGS